MRFRVEVRETADRYTTYETEAENPDEVYDQDMDEWTETQVIERTRDWAIYEVEEIA